MSIKEEEELKDENVVQPEINIITTIQNKTNDSSHNQNNNPKEEIINYDKTIPQIIGDNDSNLTKDYHQNENKTVNLFHVLSAKNVSNNEIHENEEVLEEVIEEEPITIRTR